MVGRGAVLFVMVAIGAAVIGGGNAWAQGASATLGDYGNGNRGPRGLQKDTPDNPKPSPSPRALPQVWPRLDAGAVFCQSQDALVTRAGMPAGNLPSGCRLIQRRTGITIVNRVPPGSTQVKLNPDGDVGWTDAWLPERPPLGTSAQ